MPKMLRNVDYTLADRVSVEALMDSMIDLNKESEEYLIGIAGENQIKGLMKNDIDSYKKVNQLLNEICHGVLTKDEGTNKFREITNLVQGMHFSEQLQEINRKTEYEFVHHESYQGLSEIAENMNQFKVKLEIFRANLKAREVLSDYGEKEDIFKTDYVHLVDTDELVALDGKRKAMEEASRKAYEELWNLESESTEAKRANEEKDLNQKKDLYNKLLDLESQKNQLPNEAKALDDRKNEIKINLENARVELNGYANDVDQKQAAIEDFGIKWKLDFELESDLQLKIDEVLEAQDKLKELQDSNASIEEQTQAVEKTTNLNVQLSSMVQEAGFDNAMIDEFKSIKQEIKELRVAHNKKILEYNTLKKDFDDIQKEQEQLKITHEEKVNAINNEIAAGLNTLGLKQTELTTELKTQIENAFEKKSKECSRETLENKIQAAKNVVAKIEEDRKEVRECDTYIQEHIMQPFVSFREHVYDGSKDLNQKNSKEFDSMVESLDKLIADRGKLSKEEFEERVQEVKEQTEKYLKAKESQIRLFPSKQRVARMQFAKNLISHCDDVIENQTYKTIVKTKSVKDLEKTAEIENRDLQVKNRVKDLEKKTKSVNEFLHDIYNPLIQDNVLVEFQAMYSSTPEQKERLVLPRIIATFGAPGDDMERQEYINRFFDDLDKGKRTLNADAGAFRKAYAQYKEVENNPEQLKALFEKTIERIGKYIQSQPAQLSEKNIVIAAYVKRIENMCEKKGVAVSDETKDLMKGITLLGKFARDSIKAEKALLTNKMEKGQTYKETLKKFATMKMVENRFLKGNGERSIGSISDMAKVLGDGENMQPLMNLVEETKGFHDLMACKPKSRSYIISSSNEITASLYEGISKECMEIRNKVISDVANMKEKDESVKTKQEEVQVLA